RRRGRRAFHDSLGRDPGRRRPAARGGALSNVEVRVPDLGDFDAVDVIEVHVKPGDRIAADDPLITLETDKATMDVPAEQGGEVLEVAVEVGGKVKAGDLILKLAADEAAAEKPAAEPAQASAQTGAPESAAAQRQETPLQPAPAAQAQPAPAAAASRATASPPPGKRLLVIGAGPGGYTAAFRAADPGLEVTLVERRSTLGGVCLNVGCIPSKALLHAARVVEEAAEMSAHGIEFGAPRIDTSKLRDWKNRVVGQLTRGLDGLAKQRKVRVVHGEAKFVSPHEVVVAGDGGDERIAFDQCIIAAGSEPARLPGLPDDPRIIDSTGPLELETLPE